MDRLASWSRIQRRRRRAAVQIAAVSTNSTALYVVPLRWPDAGAMSCHDGVRRATSTASFPIGIPRELYLEEAFGVVACLETTCSVRGLASRHVESQHQQDTKMENMF